ncbi:DCC1-like thiol-disulfide oxidoreductase family protein [Rossellomorea aquimaris]|uniref:DCC1-like thiol-disulfide oxidoreductase family protein n=1 Tax=Rossellomorea aquimaris TaxID=189382 RepID=UPI0037CC9F5A
MQESTRLTGLERFYSFFSAEKFLKGASLVRIGFGIVILYNYVIHYSQRHILWSSSGLLGDKRSSYTIYGIYDSPVYFELIFHLGALIALLYTLGILGRITSIVNYIFTFSLIQHSHFLSDGGDNLMYLFLFYLLFANTTAYYSVDSHWFKKSREKRKGTELYKVEMIFHNFAILACIIQVCILYMVSGLYQVMGDMWNSGTAVYYVLQVDAFSNPLFKELIINNDYLIVLSTYSAILVKLAFPFLLLNRKTKYIGVLFMVLFHIGIGVVMGLVTFSLIMIMADLVMITDEEYGKLANYYKKKIHHLNIRLKVILRRKIGHSPAIQSHKMIVFYDGWCPFCIKSVENLKRMDVFHLIRFISFRDPNVIREYKLDLSLLERRMHSQNQKGLLRDGIDSFIQISKRLPILWMALPFLATAKWIGFGQKVYDHIASRRNVVPTGKCEDECFIEYK